MRKFYGFVAFVLFVFALCACEHRPIVDPANMHYLRVYIDENLPNVTTDFYNPSYPKPEYHTPSVLRLMLCDTLSGNVKSERFLTDVKEDENGTYFEGYIACGEGTYQMLAYNWDTEVTQVMHPNNCYEAYAYTDAISTKADEIYKAPDFLFVARDIVKIGSGTVLDTLRSPSGERFDAESIVESYFFQIPFKGLENVAKISAVISGMSRSKIIEKNKHDNEPVSFYTSMAKGNVVVDITNIYATINTFGHVEGSEVGVHIVFYMDMIDGKTYSADIDVTKFFEGSEAGDNKWIVLTEPIEAPDVETGGGGFNPGVSLWEDIGSNIPF